MKPVLFVTNHVTADRLGAFTALSERIPLEVVTFGGPRRHGSQSVPYGRPVDEALVGREVRRGSWSAVVAGTAGRRSLPGAYLAARGTGTPFVHWAAFWATPRTPAHLAAVPLMRSIYRTAAAVVTYGRHVSRFVTSRGARHVFEAPQSVDNTFWRSPAGDRAPEFTVLYAGRDTPEKGLGVLREAWPEVTVATNAPREELRALYARAHVLVVPSLRTRDFREPWGLVVNEAMNQRTAIIASDEVGAAAGGLVVHERNGLVVPAGDASALRAAIERLRDDPELTSRLAEHGRRDVEAYSHAAWADGFETALRHAMDC